MKAGWERSKELVAPNLDTVRNLLRPFLEEELVYSSELLSGGLNNSNIKITTSSNQQFVLRIYNSNDDSMEIERHILNLLKGKVPVPQVLYVDSSKSILDYPFLLLSWVEGEQLSELIYRDNKLEIESAAREVGRSLARIHKIEFPDSGFFDNRLHIKESIKLNRDMFLMFIEDSLIKGHAGKHLGDNLCKSVLNFSQEHTNLIEHLGDQNSLIHGDFNPLNLMVEGKVGKVDITGILDWEYAFSGSPLMDVGNMLRYENVSNTKIFDPFISSYQKHGGHLPAQWLQKAKLLDLIALCDLLNKKECGEARVIDIKKLIQKTMDEWDRFRTVQDKFR
ncbi:phosphotransferase family protein [Pseudalkalibacillus salsuginis]|uniref:phosphotransferase family protein n=1 Tax=Pseudalkalibacillus salsuginis TaxID=2910972 RepID=UPI001F36E5D0|nr:aminoglycoside phosphotransferase family protein [Pseudalkalibacillus salsuginis]MCF6409572.1 aminoglycoside phosphotransferase family protein [Pseudalkalibacillus salsuginis]